MDALGTLESGAGGLPLTPLVATARTMDTVETVSDHLQQLPPCEACSVVVLDLEGRPVGTVGLAVLASAWPGDFMQALMKPAHPIDSHAPAEALIAHARRHGLTEVPLVDEDGRLLGMLTHRRLLELERKSHEDELARLAGIRSHPTTHHIGEDPLADLWPRLGERAPALALALLGAAALVALGYALAPALERHFAIVLFVPAVLALVDALGRQSEAVAVRAFDRGASLGTLVWHELRAAILLAGLLAAVAGSIVWFAFGSVPLAGTVAAAIAGAGLAAAVTGMLLPWAAARSGGEAALGSGPLTTAVQDLLALAIYLALALSLLPGVPA